MEIYINPFTNNITNDIDQDGTYTDLSGGTYYNWRLTPAKNGDDELMQGNNMPCDQMNARLATMTFDYSYFSVTNEHPVPSGQYYWTWQPTTNGIAASYLEQTSGPISMPREDYWIAFNRPANQSYAEITGIGNGWALVVASNYQTRVLTSSFYSEASPAADNRHIYFTEKIVGAYRINVNTNEQLVNYYVSQGYANGYNQGTADGNTAFAPLRYIAMAGSGVAQILDTPIFGSITLGTLILIPLAVTIIGVIIKILRK